jgi:hypothetical protein
MFKARVLQENGTHNGRLRVNKLQNLRKGSAENLNFLKIPIWAKYRKFEAQLSAITMTVWSVIVPRM